MDSFKFVCGCEIPIKNGRPYIDLEELFYSLNYDKTCKSTWNILAEGRTKGVFQLESHLGKQWAEKLQPESIDEMAALTALIRPSCLQAVSEGKNMTQHFVDRKHGIEQVKALNNAMEELLGDTYQIMIYQEQAITIARTIAGFTEEEADALRKAIGKKDAKKMGELRHSFVDGCKKVNKVSEEDANLIFDWIQESQRYSFNKSHATSYGQVGYVTAWLKYHFPLYFFCSWLSYAKERLDYVAETKELIAEAKKVNIQVLLPKLDLVKQNNANMVIDGKNIRFGLKQMKSMGESAIQNIISVIEEKEKLLNKKIGDWKWKDVLYHLLTNINIKNANALITAGVLDEYELSRSRKLLELQKVKELSKKQLEHLINLDLPLLDGLKKLYDIVNKTQKQKILDLISLLTSETHSMSDRISWIISSEKDIFGVPITYNPVDVINSYSGNTTCKEFADGKEDNIIIIGELDNVKKFKIKNGKNAGKMMARGSLTDETGTIDCVLFHKNYNEYHRYMDNGNLVSINGRRTDSNSLAIDRIEEVY